MGKAELAKTFSEFLVAEGYRPEIDSDGDVKFKSEGFTYYIIIDEKDPQYFRLVFPNFWSIESDAERLKALIASDFATSRTKAAKVYTVQNNMWASVEFFFAEPSQVKTVFSRCMSTLRTSVDHYVQKMREQS
ncbi:MAG: hypothetical protein Kow00124_09640 [Anaerolineae bacterium]